MQMIQALLCEGRAIGQGRLPVFCGAAAAAVGLPRAMVFQSPAGDSGAGGAMLSAFGWIAIACP